MRRLQWAAWAELAGFVGIVASLGSTAACSSSGSAASGVDAAIAGGSSSGSSGGSSSGSSGGSSSGSSGGSSSGASTPGIVGYVPGGQIGVGTVVDGCKVFPDDNAWNVAVDGPDVQVTHTYDGQLAQTTHPHPDFGGYTSDIGGIPYNTVDAGQPDLTTVFSLYASSSDPGPGGWVGANPVTTGAAEGTTGYPFFVGMKIEGNPAPGGTPGNLQGGDRHAIVLQQGASGCTSYEHGNAQSSPILLSSAPMAPCSTSRRTHCVPLARWMSGDAAGLSILAGLVRLAEV